MTPLAFKLGRDIPTAPTGKRLRRRVPKTSHHSGREDGILDFATINTFHVGMGPYFLAQLKTRRTSRVLLDSTVLIYGSLMGESNLHNHKRVFFIAGRAGGALPGGLHLKAPAGTPLANVMLSVLHALDLDNLPRFGGRRPCVPLATHVR